MPVIGLAVVLALSLMFAPLAAEGQPGAVPRIGYLSPGRGFPFEALREGLQAHGYVEGSTITIERRSAEGHPERLQDLAAELVRLRIDVIVTADTASTQAAQRVTSTTPIVFALADEPESLGIVASLAKPGANITGFTGLMVELTGKRLELLKETLPGVGRVAVLWSPHPFFAKALKEAERAARTTGLQLQPTEVRNAEELDSAFARIAERRADAVLVLPNALFVAHRQRIVELAAKHRVPTVYNLRQYVDIGGLISYGADTAHMSRRAATYVDKILKGAKARRFARWLRRWTTPTA